jgi:hypothetical protein
MVLKRLMLLPGIAAGLQKSWCRRKRKPAACPCVASANVFSIRSGVMLLNFILCHSGYGVN